jgi:hypothetical protein
MNSDVSGTVGGLLSGVLKFTLTVGGLIAGLVGLFVGNLAVVALGVGMFFLGQVVHAMDQRALDRQLQRWAAEALGGMAPVPPRSVRMRLIRSSAQTWGQHGDTKLAFQMACRSWVTEQQLASIDTSATGVTR